VPGSEIMMHGVMSAIDDFAARNRAQGVFLGATARVTAQFSK
jgi:hypothetical protein